MGAWWGPLGVFLLVSGGLTVSASFLVFPFGLEPKFLKGLHLSVLPTQPQDSNHQKKLTRGTKLGARAVVSGLISGHCSGTTASCL